MRFHHTLALLSIAGLTTGCGASKVNRNTELPPRARDAIEAAPQPIHQGFQTRLAIQLRVGETGAKVIDSKIILAPTANTIDALGSTLRVRARGKGQRVLADYRVHDPRASTIESRDRGQHVPMRLKAATIWVIAPLNAGLQEIELTPIARGGGEAPKPMVAAAGSAFQRACARRPELRACRDAQ